MGKNTQLPLADLLRQSLYSRLASYEDINDAERLAQDPTFRLIGTEKLWKRGAALMRRLQLFETDLLVQEENLACLEVINVRAIRKRHGMVSHGARTPWKSVVATEATEALGWTLPHPGR